MRIFVIRSRGVLAAAAAVLAVCLVIRAGYGTARQAVSAAAPKRDLPIYCVGTDERKASLTFDAAWGNEDTQDLIDILGQYNIKATFFVVGDWAEKYPESVKQLSDAGHEVMNHSDTHPHLTELSREEIAAQITACDEKIEAITGKKPFLTRPPYGDYNDKVVSTLRELGHYTIQWDVDSLDWKDLSAKDIYDRVTKKTCSGSIILFHNAAKNTPQALPMIIEYLQSEGFELVPVSELIYTDSFEIDHEGRQIKAAAPEKTAPAA